MLFFLAEILFAAPEDETERALRMLCKYGSGVHLMDHTN